MKRFLFPTLVATLVALLVAPGCGWMENFCDEDNCGDIHSGDCSGGNDNGCWEPANTWNECRDDTDCFPDEQCIENECVWEDHTYCWSDEDCLDGQICNLSFLCVDKVMDCPLTDECLADPDGYTPEWVGIDPVYVGEATGEGITARVEMLIDFYDDHLYGEAVAMVDMGEGWVSEWIYLTVTGSRSGANLDGQIVEQNVTPRRFDATFTAELLSASEIVGTVSVASDQGNFTFSLHLYRTSPCGCDPTNQCTENADCPADHECVDGQCVEVCAEECCDNADCPADHECVEGQCVEICIQECCDNSDCVNGDHCVNGECLTPCSGPCDCGQGEACVDGYCVPE